MLAAIAFSGTEILFKLLDSNGYEEKIRRHNHALSQLARVKEKWYENEVARTTRIQFV